MQPVIRLYDQFQPEHYDITFDVTLIAETFHASTTIIGQKSAEGPLRLHAKELTVESVFVNGEPAEFTIESDQLIIETTHVGTLTVDIESSAPLTETMYGMYPCHYELDGKQQRLIATQFEPNDAERVFPCIDEPEAKATFRITLKTDSGLTALSNMPAESQETIDNILVTRFETTPRMSSYLLAFVVGDMQVKSGKTKNGTETSIYATRIHPPESLDFALEHAIKSLEFFEEYFGVSYPLPKADHVALPDFSSGAMENWGLITYRESALLADPATSSIESRQYVATVIAHELSHQWFGNLVTMKWWNNLWLNESFASICEYLAPDAIHPDWNIWLDFTSNDAMAAYRRDAIAGVQSVQIDVNHPDEINSLFDGAIVYAKGARLMRMMQLYLGSVAFTKGLKEYFTKHQYSNTTEQDLWAALTASSGKDIAGLMNPWISQSGFPVVEATLVDGQLMLTQSQLLVGDHNENDKLWPIPLDASSKLLPELFSEKSITIAYDSPDTLQLNVHDSAHFVTHYDAELLGRLLDDVRNGTLSVIARTKLLNEHIMLARAEIIPAATLLEVISAYQHETDEHAWGMISACIAELKKFVEPDSAEETKLRAFVGKLSKERFEALGWEMKSGEPDNDTKLRPLIIGNMVYSEDQSVISEAIRRAHSSPFAELDPQLRTMLMSTSVRYGNDPSLVSALLQAYATETDPELRADYRGALTSVKQPQQIQEVLAKLTDTGVIRPQDHPHWYACMLSNRDARTSAWLWLKNNWEWVAEKFTGDKNLDYYPRYAGQMLSTPAEQQEYEAFFHQMKQDISLKRTIEMGEVDIAARVALIERQAPAVRTALQNL